MQRMLESKAPVTTDESYLTVGKLVRCYAPWAAGGRGSVVDQAKAALAVEALVRRCRAVGMLSEEDNNGNGDGVNREELVKAVESGIERRERRATEWMDRKKEGRRGKGKGLGTSKGKAGDGGDEDDEAWKALRSSGVRMRMVLKELN